jgi:hypothetical protein
MVLAVEQVSLQQGPTSYFLNGYSMGFRLVCLFNIAHIDVLWPTTQARPFPASVVRLVPGDATFLARLLTPFPGQSAARTFNPLLVEKAILVPSGEIVG